MELPQRLLVLFAIFLAASLPALAQPDEKKAVETIRKHIDELKNGKGAGEVTPQSAAAVKKVFPDYQMVIVRFRLFPVARIMPEGLRASNIYAVDKDGKFELLKDVKTMEKFFREHQKPAKTEKDAKEILGAWMTLTQEFHQDGMFKFEIQDKQFAVAQDKGLNARGRLIVMAGGNGDLVAELDYDKDGKLAKVVETAKIRPGPRPICQATKLLDTDPIVRRMAEQDLLIMGLSAREYLMEQRERATPELRAAIERVWRQIQANGW
jgi:hypothetical protein